MDLTLPQLVIHSSAYEPGSLMAAWGPVIGRDFSVLLPTRLGHLFLERANETIWFLNTWSGDLIQACDSYEQFKARVSKDGDFISKYLMPELVADLLQSGRTAEGDACYSAAVSPGIGGSLSPDNFVVMTIRAHLASTAAEYRALHGD